MDLDMEPMLDFDFGGATEESSEELLVELFDVFEGCPPAARPAAADAALDAVAPRAAAPAAPPPESAPSSSGAASPRDDGSESASNAPDHSRDMTAFLRPSSAYDRYRDANRDAVARENPSLTRLQLNEQLRLNWQAMGDGDRRQYVTAARGEREEFAKRQHLAKFGDESPWEAERPRRPLTVYDLWSRDTKPRERIPPGTKEAVVRKRITAMYQALDDATRKPYEDEYATTSALFFEEEKAWAAKWDLVKVYKGYVPRSDPAAIAQAARLDKEAKHRKPANETQELAELEKRDKGAKAGAAAADEPEEEKRPSKPMSSYNTWRRLNVEAFRAKFPELPHTKLERKILAAFKALPDDVRQPLEDAYRAKADAWKVAVADWDARHAEEVSKQKRERTRPAAGDDGDAGSNSSDDDAAPPAPTSYPKAPDMWARDLKDEYRARHPDMTPPELIRAMKAVWSALPEDDAVKKEYRDKSARLKLQYAKRFEAWNLKRFSGPKKKRRTAGPRSYDPDAIADWRLGALGADSNLSKAAHFSADQRRLLEDRKSLADVAPDDDDALVLNGKTHEALARQFALDLWHQDLQAHARGETGPSQEILKHYYTKISNWLKRRKGPAAAE